jgi:carboxymethylenebutenolidase
MADNKLEQAKIDSQVYALYDEYAHSGMSRREFLSKAAMLPVIGGAGVAMAAMLLPKYAEAHTISFTDDRILPHYVVYDSPNGISGKMRGYLVSPSGPGPFPAVVVIHENRGLNPYIEDVARRLAVEGFLALAPDGLYPVGGYPGNDDDGKKMQSALDPDKLYNDMLNSANFVKNHSTSTGKLGAVGFCYGGAVVNKFAVSLGKNLNAGVPFYGVAPNLEDVKKIKAPLMLQYAEKDDRVNATLPPYQLALEKNDNDFVVNIYEDTQHGFHNNSTPRYNEKQANLAWDRTITFFKKQLK